MEDAAFDDYALSQAKIAGKEQKLFSQSDILYKVLS